MQVLNGGEVTSITSASGDAGTVAVTAGRLTIDSKGFTTFLTGISSSAEHGTGNAGSVVVNVGGEMQVLNGGKVLSITMSSGDAGTVTITAGNLTIDKGLTTSTGISSSAVSGSTGKAGGVVVNISGKMLVLNGGKVTSRTDASGDAGTVSVTAGSIIIDSGFISSDANKGSTGKAGDVVVNVGGKMQILNGGEVASNTSASGDAGTVTVTAGSIIIDTKGIISSDSNKGSTGKAGGVVVNVSGEMQVLNSGGVLSLTMTSGDAGTVEVTAGSLTIDSSFISSNSMKDSGKAGGVVVHVGGAMQVLNGGLVASSTSASGDAGTVSVTAGSLTINSSFISSGANKGSTGKAGGVVVNVSDTMQVLNIGGVLSMTSGSGDAGTVSVTTGRLTIDKGFISSSAASGSTGKAGSVVVNVGGAMQVLNVGGVASGTLASGDAGTVEVTAGSLTIESGFITSSSTKDSTGKAGTVKVTVMGDTQLRGDPKNLDSGIHSVNDGTGDAGSVTVEVGGRLSLTGTQIATSAKNGKGGPIHINTSLLDLANSRITTSVEAGGNGGDITVHGNYLVMNTGLIQANTAMKGATGGTILINELGVIGKAGILSVGGLVREPFVVNSGKNIIQAAAPDGVNGSVTLTSPDTSTVAGLMAVGDRRIEMNPVANPCHGHRKRVSLRLKGRGRLPASVKECVWSAIPRTTTP
ncbi:conserved hypothetical protein [Gammaproteobacteria bacterium]